MNDIVKFTPSNAVVSIPLSDIDNLRFNLLSVTQELERYKESKAEVVVKQRVTGYEGKYSFPVTREEFIEFRKFDEFEDIIKQKIESKFNNIINTLQREVEKRDKKIEEIILSHKKEVEFSDKLEIELKELKKLLKSKEDEKVLILNDFDRRENEIDSLRKLTEQQLDQINKLTKSLENKTWWYKISRFLGIW